MRVHVTWSLLLLSACVHQGAPPRTPVNAAAAEVAASPRPGTDLGNAPSALPGLDTFTADTSKWPEAERAPVLAALATGRTLAARDRFAWQATDRGAEALQAHTLPTPPTGSPSRYLIDGDGTTGVVEFPVPANGDFLPWIQVTFDDAHPAGTLSAATTLAPDTAARQRALAAALADPRYKPYPYTYNLDVLPWSADPAEGWAVYLLPGATDWEAVPFGGGFLAHVSSDGDTVLSFDALSATVQVVPVATLRKQHGIYLVSVPRPLPQASELAFSTIWSVPLMILTPTSSWLVYGDRLMWAPAPTADATAPSAAPEGRLSSPELP